MINTVCVPSGIGDVSWAYSKLVNVGPLHYEVADGWPYRTVPFMELLPGVASAVYGQFNYQDIVVFEQAAKIGHHPTWAELNNGRGLERILLEPNRHLEEGKRLEDWLPDVPTSFHYEINARPVDVQRAADLLALYERPWTGISAASYRGSEAWKTWGYAEWSRFLKMLSAEVGGTIILMGGFWDDLTATLEADGYPCTVGKTSVGAAIEVLRKLDFYVGFSSGLGVIRTVLDKNAFMLWPDHQVELSTSWAPPEMLEDQRYAVSLWREPELVWKRVRLWLNRCSRTLS